MKTQNEARKAAEALQKKMHNSHDWKVRVWENLGWHYEIRNGPLSLLNSPRSVPVRYLCMMSEDKDTDGSGAHVWSSHDYWDEDPNAAVRLQVEYARGIIDVLTQTLEAAERIVHGS